MLVGDEYLRHLFWLVAQFGECLHIVLQLFAHIERCAEFLGRSLHVVLEACIHEYHLVTHVNEEVLETAAVDDLFVCVLFAFTAESKLLVHKTMVEHSYCLDFHRIIVWISIFTFCYFASSFSMLSSISFGSVVGSKRQITLPSRLMRNLVKFHLMSGFDA